jgi:hypothetical protein
MHGTSRESPAALQLGADGLLTGGSLLVIPAASISICEGLCAIVRDDVVSARTAGGWLCPKLPCQCRSERPDFWSLKLVPDYH